MEIVKISVICFVFVALGEPGMIFSFYQRQINRLPQWLNKPLGGCGICFTGQVAFWYFIFTHKYNLIDHLFFTSAAILTTMILSKIWNYNN